jgi:hypothetical protein
MKGLVQIMTDKSSIRLLKFFNVVSFILMVVVNALANILPINGIGTGAISDLYPNLFAPAGITFSIWGVIYLLLAGFVVYQLGISRNDGTFDLWWGISPLFIISSVANTIWIFSWHYQIIPLSMILMAIILVCLILINKKINRHQLTMKESIFIRLPFSVYFGWITVATIANATTLLVSLNWNGWGLSERMWMVIILLIGLAIGVATTVRNKDVAYAFVILWAYLGILIKHLSATGFAGNYPDIITTVCISMFVILLSIVYVLRNRFKS